MRIFKWVYHCSLWAFVIAITAFKITWIQMRANTGYFFWGSLVLFIVLSLWLGRKREIGIRGTVANVFICLLYGVALFGIKRLLVVPASLIRESLHMNTLQFGTINLVIAIWLVLGFAVIITTEAHKNKCKRKNDPTDSSEDNCSMGAQK
ncbi:MAG: hypothetical protein LBQ95_08525 [Lachnospiraceae bacterium]|jgi:tetrahydromethanopterin S-methyltransferase subunit E|nr:hypothetical protein [Lachnospiraceae bacterium]